MEKIGSSTTKSERELRIFSLEQTISRLEAKIKLENPQGNERQLAQAELRELHRRLLEEELKTTP